MFTARRVAALTVCALTALPGFGQAEWGPQFPSIPQVTAGKVSDSTPEIYGYERPFFSWMSRNYLPRPIGKISWDDSGRLDKLMRSGNIYLSLRDAIALALENNLDIESARYNLPQADANLLRASAGQLLTNISNSVAQGPSSATSGVLAGANGFGTGGAGASSGGGQTGVLSGLNVQLAGSAIPNLDPTFFLQGSASHSTQPLTSTFVTGTNFLVTKYNSFTYGVQQSFLTGTTLTLGKVDSFGYWQNSPNNDLNPSGSSTLQFSITQNLLKGFRPSINNRVIRVAKNQLRISDLTFKQQVIATVGNVVGLYWDLVSDIDALRVRQKALDLNTTLYEDNKRRADLGAIAPIDIIQAEAEMKAAQQDVRTAESVVLQQETILKGVLTRNGLDNMAIVSARIVPTDHFTIPGQEPVRPIQDLINEAFTARPDLEQNAIGLEDTRISMLGVKDELLPTLSVTASESVTGQAGQVNPGHFPSATFVGGYGSEMDQLFSRKFPSYSASFSLTVPIRNRSGQADLITQELQYRQAQIQDKQLHNTTKLNVINNTTALTEARSAYELAVESRKLQEETQTATRRKYELGSATILDVVTVQQTTVTRELSEVQALNTYIHARLNLDNAVGHVLDTYNVSVDDAKKGVVARPPDAIPAVAPEPAGSVPGASLAPSGAGIVLR
ncbi:MAG TPA: TolC family protein [Bryobacteraceae bacterium]|nr:TolC family protein [Bryobacteraceae bacterium]